jgi:diphosphomevalonate decarboxylase
MNDTSKAIIRLVHALNALNGSICAAYTFDAGPNAVIYTLEKFAPLGLFKSIYTSSYFYYYYHLQFRFFLFKFI